MKNLCKVKFQVQVGQKVEGKLVKVKVNARSSIGQRPIHGSDDQGSRLAVLANTWHFQSLISVVVWLVDFGPIMRQHMALSKGNTWHYKTSQKFVRKTDKWTGFNPSTSRQQTLHLIVTTHMIFVKCISATFI